MNNLRRPSMSFVPPGGLQLQLSPDGELGLELKEVAEGEVGCWRICSVQRRSRQALQGSIRTR